MKWLFWSAAALIVYTYAGYPAWLWVRAKYRPRRVIRGSCEPLVSVVMVVRNEEAVLEKKLRNLKDLDYPAEKLFIVVVSDGSTDGTDVILRDHVRDQRVQIVLKQVAAGKALGLNDGVSIAGGEILLFTDARQMIERTALRFLVENFADPEVGAVSGELMLGDPSGGEPGRGMGLYWLIEKRVRELEAAAESTVGATGALYAARRELVVEVPGGAILDDVFIPMNIARRGFRLSFDPRARAWDSPDLGKQREFARKVRTLTGNYQLLQLAPWLLRSENPLRFEFVSHKLLRLLVPFALIVTLAGAWLVPGAFYRLAFWGQLWFYGFSLLGFAGLDLGPVSRISDAAHTFVALNAAALVACGNFVTGQKSVWTQPALPKEMKA